jgi:GAF domain-containing protein
MILRQRSTARQLDDFLAALKRSITGVILLIALGMMIFQIISDSVRNVPLQLNLVIFSFVFIGLLALVVRQERISWVSDIALLCLFYGIFQLGTPLAVLGIAAGALVSASFIGSNLIFILTIVAVVVKTFVSEIPRLSPDYNFFISLIPYVSVLIIMAVLLRIFRNRLLIFMENARRTSELLTTGLYIGERLAQMTNSATLKEDAASLIREQLKFYHVNIFLNEPDNNATRLVAAAGENATRLDIGKAVLPVSARNLIGRALLAGEPTAARDLVNRADYTFADTMTETNAELVVPILEGERIIGALDLHSIRSQSFFREEVQSLQLISNQLGTAIRNARLLAEQEESAKENRRLLVESEMSLREVERLNRQLTRQSWDEYLRGQGVVSGVTFADNAFKPGAEWSTPMYQAVTRRRAVNNLLEDGKRLIALPIELRGEVVGALEIETQDNAFQNETLELLRTLSERLAISLDNARLFEESQQTTAQEQRISEIVTGYQSAVSVEELLKITLEGLTEALGAEQGAIRLGNLQTADASTNGEHHA